MSISRIITTCVRTGFRSCIFFDGHNLFSDADATYGVSWGLKEFLDTWAKEVIVVGIECGHAPGQRLDEYSPYPMKIMGHQCLGKGEETFDWIIQTLKPKIDRQLRTWPQREATAIAGSSMGGLMALYGTLVHNDVFGKAACLSPSVAPCIDSLMEDVGRVKMDPDTRIYFSHGQTELNEKGRKAMDRLLGALHDRQVNYRYFVQEHGEHNEKSWGRLVPAFMSYLWLEK